MTRNPPALLGRYPIADSVKDYVRDLSLRHPARGHRAVQFAVRVPPQNLLVEIQLMTLLQNAWDCRNHPLYEWSREGGPLPVDLSLRDVALAESLYLLDHQATQNFRTFLRLKKKNGGAPMSQPLYLSYFADEEGRRWGLSLLLEQDRFNRQPHEWLGPLHAAADGWQAGFPRRLSSL